MSQKWYRSLRFRQLRLSRLSRSRQHLLLLLRSLKLFSVRNAVKKLIQILCSAPAVVRILSRGRLLQQLLLLLERQRLMVPDRLPREPQDIRRRQYHSMVSRDTRNLHNYNMVNKDTASRASRPMASQHTPNQASRTTALREVFHLLLRRRAKRVCLSRSLFWCW